MEDVWYAGNWSLDTVELCPWFHHVSVMNTQFDTFAYFMVSRGEDY
jgi:hypothetical protein